MISSNRFDWYEEDFAAFILSLDLPAYRNNMTIDKVIKEERESFINAFNEMVKKKAVRFFSDEFYSELLSVLPRIKENFDALNAIIEHHDNAEMAKAQHKFDELMEHLEGHLLTNGVLGADVSPRLYRIRVSDKQLKEPKELFHIPYNKRHLMGNGRYSLAGQPCLYLSTNLQIAWQECGYPNKFYYSEFQYQPDAENEWQFITFLSPKHMAREWFVGQKSPEANLEMAKSYLLTYPLIFACSIVNLNGNTAFKPEFIIPQMLMQWLYRHYETVKGIMYFPCYNTNDLYSVEGYNVVLPAKNIDRRRGLSKDLISKFKVSEPQLLENKLGENEMNVVQKYKQDLIVILQSAFLESVECLWKMFELADLLDQALRNTESADMRLITRAIINVRDVGQSLIKKYSKEDIVNAIRSSATFSKRLDNKVLCFISVYDRFETDIIRIANDFNSMIDRLAPPIPKEFNFV